MHSASRLDAALGAASRFLREVAGEVSDMAEVEVGTAKGAVRVFGHDVFCGTKKLGRGVA